MKAAIVGCGGLGRVHASFYAGREDLDLTAVCDLQNDLASELAEQTGAVAYASFEQMLEQAEFDVLSLTLPSFLHKKYALLAAKAGKHIICEKPIALSLEDAEQMIQCCEENGVRLFVGHVVRFFPEYVNLKQTLDQGKIGRACVAHASRISSHPGDIKPWFSEPDKSGGVIVDLMIHDLDFLRWTLGEVKSVYGLNRCDDKQDYALVTLQFESGAVANVEAHWGYPGPFQTKAEIAGSEGIIAADSMKSSSFQLHKAPSPSESNAFVTVPQSPGHRSPYELELAHFISCIHEGTEAIVTPDDAYRALELAIAARKSVQSGLVVHLPLNERQDQEGLTNGNA